MNLKPVLRKGLLCAAVTCAPIAQAADCTFSSTPINFGAVMQLDPQPVDVQGMVTVECVADFNDVNPDSRLIYTDYEIRFSAGNSGNPAMRSMTGPLSNTLPYNLFQDPAHTVVWGDGSNGTSTRTGQITYTPEEFLEGSRKQDQHICYARIPGGVDVLPGSYSDTIQIILAF